jgi:hypothetical protein
MVLMVHPFLDVLRVLCEAVKLRILRGQPFDILGKISHGGGYSARGVQGSSSGGHHCLPGIPEKGSEKVQQATFNIESYRFVRVIQFMDAINCQVFA